MRVRVFVSKWVEMKRSAVQRIAKCQKEGLCYACLKPLQGRAVRHCHLTCVKATYRAIAAGKCTDEERVEEGRLAEATKGGRPASNPVSLEFDVGAAS